MWGQLANTASCTVGTSNTQNLSGLGKASQWISQTAWHAALEHPTAPCQPSHNWLLSFPFQNAAPSCSSLLSPNQLLRCNPPEENQPCLSSTHITSARPAPASAESCLIYITFNERRKSGYFHHPFLSPTQEKQLTLLEIYWNPRFKTPRSFQRCILHWIWSETCNEEKKGKSSDLSPWSLYTTKIYIF